VYTQTSHTLRCWDCLIVAVGLYYTKESSAAHSVFNMSYSKRAAFTCAAVSVLVLVLAPIHLIQGFPNGAPTTACASMTPGHGVGAQTSASPFMTELLDGVNSNCLRWYYTQKCRLMFSRLCSTILWHLTGDGSDGRLGASRAASPTERRE
jgi:hypothetical protein